MPQLTKDCLKVLARHALGDRQLIRRSRRNQEFAVTGARADATWRSIPSCYLLGVED